MRVDLDHEGPQTGTTSDDEDHLDQGRTERQGLLERHSLLCWVAMKAPKLSRPEAPRPKIGQQIERHEYGSAEQPPGCDHREFPRQ